MAIGYLVGSVRYITVDVNPPAEPEHVEDDSPPILGGDGAVVEQTDAPVLVSPYYAYMGNYPEVIGPTYR